MSLLANFRRTLTAVTVSALAIAATAAVDAAAAPVTMTNYTDPAQALTWGQKSHWKQPWRSYLETVPAQELIDAAGINFNVKASWAPATAELLGASGFHRARFEVPWGTIDDADPDEMNETALANLETTLVALHENGIRPLILLNANQGDPCPVSEATVELTEPAEAGATEIHVNPLDLPQISPGRTGIRSGGVAAQYLFTSIAPDGTVQLSAPLGSITPATTQGTPVVSALPAGPLATETLLYEPFHAPIAPDRTRSASFEATLAGWLDYVGVVTREAKRILGSEEFDVEVWNELSFGSRFLATNSYYEPDLEPSNAGVTEEILARTVTYLREPLHGTPNIGIGDGFANETPWPSAANTPVGLTAIDKHPYPKVLSFPEAGYIGGNRPLDGTGAPAGREVGHSEWMETFTPTYEAFFPEYTLSGIQTETLMHDIAPLESSVGGVEHGRFVHAPGGEPAQEWITELNLNPTAGPVSAEEMGQAGIRRIMTKDTLRSLVAFVNKGVSALDFYAAKAGNFSLIEPSFFTSMKGPHPAYPGELAGGETMAAVKRLMETMQGAEPISTPRRLHLRTLTDPSSNVQFEGNGTAAYPPLYNRDVFAFLPFQVNARRFAVPVYVMTRDVAEIYQPGLPTSDPDRFDMPSEPYDLEITGVDGNEVEVGATDPLTGESTPVQVLERSDESVTLEVWVTDSPRVLTLQEGAAGTPPAEEPEAGAGATGSTSPAPPKGGGTTKPKEGGVHGGAGHGGAAGEDSGEEVAALAPRFELRSLPTLLTKRRLTVLAQYRAPYQLGVGAELRIGGSSVPLRPGRAVRQVTVQGRTPVVLGIGRTAATRALAALRRGAKVTLRVTVEADGSGPARRTRRSFPIRG